MQFSVQLYPLIMYWTYWIIEWNLTEHNPWNIHCKSIPKVHVLTFQLNVCLTVDAPDCSHWISFSVEDQWCDIILQRQTLFSTCFTIGAAWNGHIDLANLRTFDNHQGWPGSIACWAWRHCPCRTHQIIFNIVVPIARDVEGNWFILMNTASGWAMLQLPTNKKDKHLITSLHGPASRLVSRPSITITWNDTMNSRIVINYKL